tara:strand:- start:245 stop:457 length:213 start_codon:yes stop_codon:yes gene_type:complete
MISENPAAEGDVLVEVDIEKKSSLSTQQGFPLSPGVKELRVISVEGEIDREIDSFLGERGTCLRTEHEAG